MDYLKNRILIVFLLLFIPIEVFANAGLPMIIIAIPVFGYSLIPIIFIETIWLSKKLKLNFIATLKNTTLANLASTLIGIPLTWILLLVVQYIFDGASTLDMDTIYDRILSVTLQAPWLIPYESELHWMIPTAGIFLLIPFFFVSWWSEYIIYEDILKDNLPKDLNQEVRNANMITYALLLLWPIGYLLFL